MTNSMSLYSITVSTELLCQNIDNLSKTFSTYDLSNRKICFLFTELFPVLKQFAVWCAQPQKERTWQDLKGKINSLLQILRQHLLSDVSEATYINEIKWLIYQDFTLALKYPQIQLLGLDGTPYYLPTICVAACLDKATKSFFHNQPLFSFPKPLFCEEFPAIPIEILTLLLDHNPFQKQDPFILLVSSIFCYIIGNPEKGQHLFEIVMQKYASASLFQKLFNQPQILVYLPDNFCLAIAEDAFKHGCLHLSDLFSGLYSKFLARTPITWSEELISHYLKYEFFSRNLDLRALLTKKMIECCQQNPVFLGNLQESNRENTLPFAFGLDYCLQDVHFLITRFHLTSVAFARAPLQKEDFQALAAYSNLTELKFGAVNFSSECLLFLRPIPLKQLMVTCNPNQDLSQDFGKRLPLYLNCLLLCKTTVIFESQNFFSQDLCVSLQKLTLKNTLCEDGIFGGCLTQLSHLAFLEIQNTPVKDVISYHLPYSLQRLTLQLCPITGAFFRGVQANQKVLSHLCLIDVTQSKCTLADLPPHFGISVIGLNFIETHLISNPITLRRQ